MWLLCRVMQKWYENVMYVTITPPFLLDCDLHGEVGAHSIFLIMMSRSCSPTFLQRCAMRNKSSCPTLSILSFGHTICSCRSGTHEVKNKPIIIVILGWFALLYLKGARQRTRFTTCMWYDRWIVLNGHSYAFSRIWKSFRAEYNM